MEIRPLRTEDDYRAVLAEVSDLVDLDPEIDTPEGVRLDVLATLVEAYECKHYPIGPPNPIEAIKFRLEQQGLTPKDLPSMMGGLKRFHDVPAGKRHQSHLFPVDNTRLNPPY